MEFVNRESELSLLEEMAQSGQAELWVLYGHRRVGKTELLRHFSLLAAIFWQTYSTKEPSYKHSSRPKPCTMPYVPKPGILMS